MDSTLTRTASELWESAAARILLVEDERLVAISLKRQLQALRYTVVGQVASGKAAIEQAGELRPDLVLMDIRLEGEMDGIEAAAEIYKRFQLPVIYLTAFSNQDVLDRAKATEPLGYILKPYEERELQVVIEMALYRHRAERARSVLRAAESRRQKERLAPLALLGLDANDRISALSPREAETMNLIVSGKSQKEIAAELGITIQTAAKHRAKVLAKLGIANDVELVRLALAIHLHAPRT